MNTNTRTLTSKRTVVLLLAQSLPLALGACAAPGPAEKIPGSLYQTIDPASHPVMSEVLKQTAGRSPMRVTFDPAEAATSDYRLDLSFGIRDKGMHDTEVIWTTTTILLFTMYPSTCGHYELTLDGELYDRDGEHLKSWSIVEQDTAFLWLFQGDDCGAEPSAETLQKIAAELVDRLYARMERDGVFSGGPIRQAADYPLVYVEAANATALVEKVLRIDEPFPNYTMNRAEAAAAERTLRIEFEFLSPEQSLAGITTRGMASIMTIGLVGVCPANTMVLNAEVLGSDGSVVGRYQFRDKKRASILNDCAAPTDETHPELAAKLLRKLIGELKRNKIA